jgi:adenosylmethionine-8-amino-7-oxononanoate aminotransferase
VVEPLVQGAAGMLLQPKGYLKKLREACDAHGVLLIADEVATGFGRTGTFFAVEQEDVRPDLLCLAKGITGGYLPLAATLAREEIFEGFLGPYESRRTFFHGHTYTGNALGCAAALASLRIFDTDRTLERLQPKIARVEEKSPRRDYPAKIRMGHQVTREARRNGAVIRPLGDVVVLMPPLSMSEPELDRLLEITARAIETATSIPRG